VEACPTGALVVGTFEEFRLVLAQPVERPFTQETVTLGEYEAE
jgi:hypothetical protein